VRNVILMIFALGGFALVGVTLLARRRGTRPDDDSRVPSLGDLAAFVMSYQVGRLPIGRVAVLGFWWWLGWHFLAR
jgi:hypothetical protein